MYWFFTMKKHIFNVFMWVKKIAIILLNRITSFTKQSEISIKKPIKFAIHLPHFFSISPYSIARDKNSKMKKSNVYWTKPIISIFNNFPCGMMTSAIDIRRFELCACLTVKAWSAFFFFSFFVYDKRFVII